MKNKKCPSPRLIIEALQNEEYQKLNEEAQE